LWETNHDAAKNLPENVFVAIGNSDDCRPPIRDRGMEHHTFVPRNDECGTLFNKDDDDDVLGSESQQQ